MSNILFMETGKSVAVSEECCLGSEVNNCSEWHMELRIFTHLFIVIWIITLDTHKQESYKEISN